MTIDHRINRRQFMITTGMAGGGLLLSFFIPSRQAAAAGIAPQPWTASTASGAEVNAWLMIGSDDSVTIRVAQSEMGQGVFTSLPMLVAEELDCDWQKVHAEYASANRSLRENRVYQRMATGGSRAVRASREYVQQAGASARARLVAAAAQQWGVPAGECRTENGMVLHPASGRKVNYGAVATAAAGVKLDAEPPIKTPDRFKLLGKPLNRLDVPPKVNGSAIYGIDVRLPDMLYAAVMTCPVFGGKLRRHDFDAIKGMPGVRTAVEIPNGIAVVADSYWRAKTALEVMPVEWDFGPHAKADSEDFWKTFREALDKPGAVAKEEGDALAGIKAATKVVEADYEAPYLAHATMEPMNCTAQVTAQRVDVWVGTQNPEAVLAAAAEITGVGPENVYVHNCFLGGGFGRRSNPDDVRQAVTVAKALGGRPVKLIWSREEDMRHDFYRPMAAIRFRAALDANGMPTAYFNRSVTHSILSSVRPGDVKGGIDRTSVEGLANVPYGFPQLRVEHLILNTPVPVWFWRSVGASQNAFAVEGFINELALAAGKDPVELRRQLLKGHADWLLVLDTVAQKANWGKTMPQGTAQGIAIAESYGSIVAEVAEVAVSRRGEVRVERVVCAIDCGHVVNPLTVAEQMESSVVWGLTAALYGQITVKDGRVVEGNFDDYPMLRLDAMPEVETHLALSGGDKWGGVGEPGVPPLAPAVCHGVFGVTGKRIRSLPLRKHDLNWT
ncbi:MAG TPA: xanthine dehydrogenase family protein molybdopterin-binding subunit [Candidatus Tectomicrobia bacterium]|nr:xanthine dehydrogenase family protein molybdopterin-binding subunit [Candidatus Tectomicrobia bacterium]